VDLDKFENSDAKSIVQRDVRSFMEHALVAHEDDEGAGFSLGGPFTPSVIAPWIEGVDDEIKPVPLQDQDGVFHVIPWCWTGVDSQSGIAHLGPTYKRLTVRGVTIVTRLSGIEGDAGFRLYRFIDWLDAFAQAGISIGTRPIVDPGRKWLGEADKFERQAQQLRTEGESDEADALDARAKRRKKQAKQLAKTLQETEQQIAEEAITPAEAKSMKAKSKKAKTPRERLAR